MERGCRWEDLGGGLVVTYCDDTGAPEQWAAYLAMMNSMRGRTGVRYLIYVGVVPSREVLAALAGAARGQPWQVALLSPSTAVRFAASTFALIVKGFRFFPPERLKDALLHLGCAEAEQQRVTKSLERVRGSDTSLLPLP